jgi:hypothetical protein
MRISGLFVIFFYLNLAYASGQGYNPFDIFRSDSLLIQRTIVPPAESIIEETKLEGDNPFSISHIPIRKNQYRQIEELKINQDNKKENISISYLPLWVLVFSLCLLAFILINKKGHIMTLLRSVSNDNFMRLTQSEEKGGHSLIYILGYGLFLLNIALFIYLLIDKLFPDAISYNYAGLLGFVSLFFVGKHLVLAFFSWVYEFEKEARLYDFTIITFRNILAIIFLSFNIIIVFGPVIWIKPIAFAVFTIFIIFLSARFYKGMRIARTFLNDNFFHFFLYFCAFEFSPWLIVYTLIRDLI